VGVPSISRRVVLSGLAGALASCAARRTTLPPPSSASARTPRAIPPSARSPRAVPIVYDERGGLFVEVTVAGESARLILDTAASCGVLAPGFADALGLAREPSVTVEGSAGTLEADVVRAEVELAADERVDGRFTVYDAGSYDPRCAGILGFDVLGRWPFALRYAARELVLDAPPPSELVPLRLDRGIPCVGARVNGIELELRVDTGAALPPGDDSYVNLTADQAEAAGLGGPPLAVWSATGTGGASLALEVHRLESFTLGAREIPRAFAIVQPRVGYFAREDALGFLGNSVLDKLDPFVDAAGGRFGLGADS
jgi:predicted aspartyl protease